MKKLLIIFLLIFSPIEANSQTDTSFITAGIDPFEHNLTSSIRARNFRLMSNQFRPRVTLITSVTDSTSSFFLEKSEVITLLNFIMIGVETPVQMYHDGMNYLLIITSKTTTANQIWLNLANDGRVYRVVVK